MPFWLRMGPFEVVAARSIEAAETVPLSGPQQSTPRYEQIREGAGHEETVRVLVQAAIAQLGKAEHPLDHADAVLDLCPHLRFGPEAG